jgi:hypothetical protein
MEPRPSWPRGTQKAWREGGNQKHDDSQKNWEYNDQEEPRTWKACITNLPPSMSMFLQHFNNVFKVKC